MSLLLDPVLLPDRALIANGTLAPLAQGLRFELQPLIDRLPAIPTEKALLSRVGGRCAADGTMLGVDPFDARHICPACGREYAGMAHDRFRLYWYQLWLAERALHAAVLGALLGDLDSRRLAERLLNGFAERYQDYPVADSVLGPSRPFFSTYLESIWLLQLMLALDVLESSTTGRVVTALGSNVRDRIVSPSLELITLYDEGMSNRQVWNNAALMAGGALLGRSDLVERAVDSRSGLHAHLQHALLSDGTWYEGENYHLFAHRGLWYGVQLSRRAGYALPHALEDRYREGFAAPMRSLLPDLTYPSRRDSQYAVSVRQPRFAESLEMGLAEHDDERLSNMLGRLYTADIPRRDTARSRTSADVERNVSATALTRADLSWRSLLFARANLPAPTRERSSSALLEGQGLAVLRREEGMVYVSLDYGHSGGGHGHPDRLNLSLMAGPARWFDDPGTGSYVDRSLHWYRSTLAHNAPLVDDRSQPRVHGELVAFDEREGAGWVSASAELGAGLTVTRTVVVKHDYLIDEVEWHAGESHMVSLPFHQVELVDEADLALAGRPGVLPVSTAPEDGGAFAQRAERLAPPSGSVRARGRQRGSRESALRGWIAAPAGTEWWRADVPSAPGVKAMHPVLLVRSAERASRFVSVWTWRSSIEHVTITATGIAVNRPDGTADEHRRTASGWQIVSSSGVVMLDGAVLRTEENELEPREALAPPPAIRLPFSADLGELHYRRSEYDWHEAGSPTAAVQVSVEQSTLQVRIHVMGSQRRFIPIDTENPLDNEPAAINGDGVQLYLRSASLNGAWLLVPESSTTEVGVRPIEGWGDASVRAVWNPTNHGYELFVSIALPSGVDEFQLDAVINETTAGRARRRGQLVLSGAHGEFVYLRGDRHDPSRLIRFSLHD